MAKSPQSSSLFSGLWAKPPLAEVSVLQLPRVKATDVAVVWFTPCDLRTHDHDGLVAAAGAAGVVPVFVFDDQVGCDFASLTRLILFQRVRMIHTFDLVPHRNDALRCTYTRQQYIQ